MALCSLVEFFMVLSLTCRLLIHSEFIFVTYCGIKIKN